MRMPTIRSYRAYPTANAMMLELGNGVTVWFSYSTPVAFETPTSGLVVRENSWGPTTGRHLAMIEAQCNADRRSRVSEAEFADLWDRHASSARA